MAVFQGGLLMEVQLMWFSSSQMQNAIKRGSYYIWRRPAIIIVYKCVSCKHNILKQSKLIKICVVCWLLEKEEMQQSELTK